MTTALASCMRNEGIFVLEWLAYHHGMFERVIVVTNDCTDGSDALLDVAQEMGLCTHIRQTVPEGGSPQDLGMDHVLRLCRAEGISHVLHIDSDEFLFLPEGDVTDLLNRTHDADVIPIPWLPMGDTGVTDWTPGDLVVERNIRAAPGLEPGETKFKCLFKVASFARATDHNPLEPLVDDPQVRSPNGKKLRNATLYQPKSARFRPLGKACEVTTAFLFHYAVKSEDVFLMKNDRGDGQGKDSTKYHLGSHWHRQANRNDVDEHSLLLQAPRLRARLEEWRRSPALAEAEQACHAWFMDRRTQILTPENRALWTRGKATA